MLSGTGSNIYVQNLCRALSHEGHDVHLICQEPDPLDYDFVGEHATVDAEGSSRSGERETAYPGLGRDLRPDIGASCRSTSTTTTRDGA